jgi:hypothetical protein
VSFLGQLGVVPGFMQDVSGEGFSFEKVPSPPRAPCSGGDRCRPWIQRYLGFPPWVGEGVEAWNLNAHGTVARVVVTMIPLMRKEQAQNYAKIATSKAINHFEFAFSI